VVEHDGSVEIEWRPPFEVIESAVIVKDGFEVEATGAKRSDREVPEHPNLDYDRIAYDLGQKGTGMLRVTVSGLLRTNPIYRWLGVGFGTVLVVALVVGLVLRPKGDTRARLSRRRDDLLAALEQRRSEAERRRLVSALDRIYRQLDALDAFEAKAAAGRKGDGGGGPPAATKVEPEAAAKVEPKAATKVEPEAAKGSDATAG
jgi:hypothetical protein